MPKPSQREILYNITKHFDQLSRAFCALVESLRPEDIDATIHKLHVEAWAERRMRRCELEDARKELAEAQAEIERLRPLAENWQLVLGMRPGSRLTRELGLSYWGVFALPDKRTRHCGPFTNPIEALRSIQKVGDDQD